MKHNVLAIIPARGGSKGIHRKNICQIAGKPLLAYSIEHAQQTPAISRIIVSTDDPEIADIAKQYGAEVVWRPEVISNDTASSESALIHVLQHLQQNEDYQPDVVVFLQATSPIRQPDDIQNALEQFEAEQADSLLSVSPIHGFVWRKTGDQISSFSYDYRHRQRRQDAPQDFIENGSIYIFKPEILLEHKNRLGGKISLYVMNPLDSFQVDEPTDLTLIEKLLELRS